MKSFLILSFALLGLECAGEHAASILALQKPDGIASRHSQEIDVFSIGGVFDEPKSIAQPRNALRRTLHDNPQLMRDYQQKWETYLKSSHPKPTPILSPSRTEILR